jgi:hypothetical protein
MGVKERMVSPEKMELKARTVIPEEMELMKSRVGQYLLMVIMRAILVHPGLSILLELPDISSFNTY